MRYKKLKYPLFLLPFITILMIQADIVLAQNTDDTGRVRNALEVTDEVIREARAVVEESRSQKGRMKLSQAETMQKQAWESYRLSTNLRAYDLTLEARRVAYQAIGFARLEAKTEEKLTWIIENTKERIAKVRDLIIESDIIADRPMKLLEEARNLLYKSQLNAQQLRYQLALKLAETAHQQAIQAEQQVRQTRILKAMVERKISLLERLFERAREQVMEGNFPKLRNQLRIAEEQLVKARGLLREGRYRAAKVTLEKCEKNFRSLIRRIPTHKLTDPRNLLDEAYRLLERAEEMIGRSERGMADTRQRALIEEAKNLLTTAEDEISRGRIEEAKRLITEARKLLRESIAAEKKELTREQVVSQINGVENLRDEVLSILEACSVEGVPLLIERATDHLDKARAYLADGMFPNASAEARIARNLYNRIRELCSIL